MYRVVRQFADAYDGEHVYNVGDAYPRQGIEVSSGRLEELSSSNNKCGFVFIVNKDAEEGLSEVKEGVGEAEAGVNPPEEPEAKEKPRRRKGK